MNIKNISLNQFIRFFFVLFLSIYIPLSGYTVLEHNHFGSTDPTKRYNQPHHEQHPELCRLLHILLNEKSIHLKVFLQKPTIAHRTYGILNILSQYLIFEIFIQPRAPPF